jgi:hypothetical protein
MLIRNLIQNGFLLTYFSWQETQQAAVEAAQQQR